MDFEKSDLKLFDIFQTILDNIFLDFSNYFTDKIIWDFPNYSR